MSALQAAVGYSDRAVAEKFVPGSEDLERRVLVSVESRGDYCTTLNSIEVAPE
jgi:hypothetical protein